MSNRPADAETFTAQVTELGSNLTKVMDELDPHYSVAMATLTELAAMFMSDLCPKCRRQHAKRFNKSMVQMADMMAAQRAKVPASVR